jgi:fatty-acyl-CoA synthase
MPNGAHPRARRPSQIHLEILPELPKTAVGKIFKPDLRKRAIKRTYDAALGDMPMCREVVDVTEDKRRGLVARIGRTGTVTDEEVVKSLGAFTRPWEWAD